MEQQILMLCAKIEKEVQDLEYGSLSVNVIIVNGVPEMKTLNIVRSKRIKYQKEGDSGD